MCLWIWIFFKKVNYHHMAFSSVSYENLNLSSIGDALSIEYSLLFFLKLFSKQIVTKKNYFLSPSYGMTPLNHFLKSLVLFTNQWVITNFSANTRFISSTYMKINSKIKFIMLKFYSTLNISDFLQDQFHAFMISAPLLRYTPWCF